MALSLLFTTSKRLLIVNGPLPGIVDSVSIGLTDAFLIISYGIWFFSSLRSWRYRAVVHKTLVIPFLGLCAACAFSVVQSSNPGRGVLEFIRMFKTLALYWFLIYNIRDLKEVRWIFVFLGIGLLAEFGFCLVEKYFAHGSLGLKYFGESTEGMVSFVGDRSLFRAGGTLGHPNNLAYYLDLMIPLMLTRVFSLRHGKWSRLFFFAAFSAGCGCLYFTQSRGGIVATGISLSLCFLILAWRNMRLRVFTLQTLGVALLSLAVVGVFQHKIFARFGQNDSGAVRTRVDQYHVAYRMLAAHPWVGVGLNTYVQESPAYDNTASKVASNFRAPVHNVYLLALTETGIIGFAGLAGLMFFILRMARFWTWPYGEIFDLHLGFFCSLIGYFIHANVDINPMGSYTALFFLLGLLTVVHQIGLHRTAYARAS